MNTASAPGCCVDLAAESVAGEEDPGASIDLAASDTRASSATAGDQPGVAAPPMSPGDEAPVGTPGTGEDLCRTCGGSGLLNGSTCPDCEGTGKINVGIGGA
jgi:hypothetical protein